MAKYVKVILFLLLTVALYGVASNISTENQMEQDEHITYSINHQGQITNPDFPYIPVAELTNLQGHQISVTRIQRLQRMQLEEYFSSLKSALQCCADRESSLSQHRGRIYDTTTSYACQPSSEYYVFALRRIII